MECERCGKLLSGKQERWCSQRCSRLGLKALYKERNREKLRKYSKEYRKRIKIKRRKFGLISLDNECYFCLRTENLVYHHIIYEPEIMIRLCSSCHGKLHKIINLEKRNIK